MSPYVIIVDATRSNIAGTAITIGCVFFFGATAVWMFTLISGSAMWSYTPALLRQHCRDRHSPSSLSGSASAIDTNIAIDWKNGLSNVCSTLPHPVHIISSCICWWPMRDAK